MLIATLVVNLILGAVSSFYGYRIFRAYITFLGGIIGAYAGFCLGEGNVTWAIVFAVALALIVGILAFRLYKLGVAILGFFAGSISAYLLCGHFGVEPVLWISTAAGVVMGFLTLKLSRVFIVVSTALSGSTQAVQSFWMLFIAEKITQQTNLQEFLTSGYGIAQLVCTLILFAAGMIIQFRSMPGKEKTV